MAANYPHGLPETLTYLANLSASKDGIKVIQKIMNAQSLIISQMNGFNLTCLIPNHYPIFILLSACEEGISVLHEVLDFHQENFVKHITFELMHSRCKAYDPRSTAFEVLQKSVEGKRLLERFKTLGWIPPTSQNLFAFFGNEAPPEPIDSKEDQNVENALPSSNPWKPD